MSEESSSGDENDLPDLVQRDEFGPDDDDRDFEDEDKYVDSLKAALDLFSKKTFKTAEECIEHCRNVHGLDLVVLKKRHNMDTFSYIRLINYLRAELPSPGFVMSLSSDTKWQDNKFMKPVIEDDPLLMYNFEDDEEDPDEEETGFGIDISRDLNDQIENPRVAVVGGNVGSGGCQSIDDVIQKELQEQIEALKLELTDKQMELVQCQQDMIKMRSAAQSLFSGLEESKASAHKIVSVSDHKTVEEDSSYFQSYAHFSIHHEMLSDSVRTESYRKALLENSDMLTGKTVLDLGCGTGILSMFAAEAGSKTVVGVDCSDVIYQAIDIVRENGLTDKVQLVKGRLEETKLPVEGFDFIVSEWMGYFLLFEGMLDSVIAARDKFLNPGGMVVPNRCTINMVAISDELKYSKLIGFWDDVYGFKMSCMRTPILEEASVEVVPADSVISSPATVLSLDLNTCTIADTEFTEDFRLEITKSGHLTALVGYFDTFFDMQSPVMFSTGPGSTPTHWKQTVFYLPNKMAVTVGQSLQCRIVCKRMKTDARSLKVALTVDGLTLKYTVD